MQPDNKSVKFDEIVQFTEKAVLIRSGEYVTFIPRLYLTYLTDTEVHVPIWLFKRLNWVEDLNNIDKV